MTKPTFEQIETLRDLIVRLDQPQQRFARLIGWNETDVSKALANRGRWLPRECGLRLALIIERHIANSAEEVHDWLQRLGFSLDTVISDYRLCLKLHRQKSKKLPRWHIRLANVPINEKELGNAYVRRENLIWQLKKRILDPSGGRVIVVVGIPDGGKSTLAKATLFELIIRARFRYLFWLEPGDKKSTIITLAHQLRIDLESYQLRYTPELERLQSKVFNRLKKSRRVLIAVDGVESSEIVEPLLEPLTGHSKLIVTTQSLELAKKLRVSLNDVVMVDVMSPSESAEMVRKKLRDSNSRFDPEVLFNLPMILGGEPSGIEIATEIIKHENSGDRLLTELYMGNELHALSYDQPEHELHSLRMSYNKRYELLSANQQKCFRALCTDIISYKEIGISGLAFLLDWSIEDTENALSSLVNYSLIQRIESGGYRISQLMRRFAEEKTAKAGESAFLWEKYHWLVFGLVLVAIRTNCAISLGERRYYIPSQYLADLCNRVCGMYEDIMSQNAGTTDSLITAISMAINKLLELPAETNLFILDKYDTMGPLGPIFGDELLDEYGGKVVIFYILHH